jgi:phage-related protein
MKPIEFRGDSLDRLRELPEEARREAGFQLDRVQRGLEPFDWKPMSSVGAGVREIRVRSESCMSPNLKTRYTYCTVFSRRLRPRRSEMLIWRRKDIESY